MSRQDEYGRPAALWVDQADSPDLPESPIYICDGPMSDSETADEVQIKASMVSFACAFLAAAATDVVSTSRRTAAICSSLHRDFLVGSPDCSHCYTCVLNRGVEQPGSSLGS
jgi:hypothetical protein